MKPFLGRVALVAVVLVGLPWLASALGEVVAGPTPETSTGGSIEEGEAPVAPPVVDSSTEPAALVTPRATPSKASRSRSALQTQEITASGSLMDVTCYASGTITASGKRPQVGMVATLDRSIPFGTWLHIEGLGTYVVEDRVGHGADVDVYGPSESYCRDFGRKHLLVTVER